MGRGTSASSRGAEEGSNLRSTDIEFQPGAFRRLYRAIHEYRGYAFCADVLERWQVANAAVIDWLQSLATRSGDQIPPVLRDELWELYALSRVNETLLLWFQDGRADGADYLGPAISTEEYLGFMRCLGLVEAAQTGFSPFLHEIVEVIPADDEDEPIVFVEMRWPALMLGNMMVSRAGVVVSGGRRHIRKEIAENSVLYWAFRRKHRRVADLSVGWGSNSQWRTDFRRDYLVDDKMYFNVDAKPNSRHRPEEPDRDGLTPDERRELLLNRCFITVDKPSDDLWPYDDRYRMQATAVR